MNFTTRFQAHYEFTKRIRRYAKSYFIHLRDTGEEVRTLDFDKPDTLHVDARFLGFYYAEHYYGDPYDEPRLVFRWRYSGPDYVAKGNSMVLLSEFEEYAEEQWELDEFDQKLKDEEV